jgi:hypothetical protein
MKRIRISGLARLAKQVRQELSEPISAERLARLREDVSTSLATISRILHEKGARPAGLPAPSRKAYQFLKDLDFDSIVAQDTPATNDLPPDSVSFVGLPGYFDHLLNRLARYDGRSQLEEVYDLIRSTSESIEDEIRAKDIRPKQLRKPTREMRGWLAYFAQRANFDLYCAAVQRAEPVFRAASTWPAGPSIAVLVHFRPMQEMYRIRRYDDGVPQTRNTALGGPGALLVRLPTPMICLDRELLRTLAEAAFQKSRSKKPVHDATTSEPYRRIASELELLGGVVTQTRGIHHDLAASFDRVNAAYFQGSLSRPRLVWSRTFAVRKFGHYDQAHDTVMLNAVLDRKTVPEYALDFIVYHELLHKKLGVTWKSNRMAAHTRQFTEEERRFQQYEQAKAALRKLASER